MVKWNDDLMGSFSWICGGCETETIVSHFRQGADGVTFHAGPDAPPSDETNQSESKRAAALTPGDIEQ
jgi:hypothetical protein